jgi:transcriptional regulator with XRE-family HTH domain
MRKSLYRRHNQVFLDLLRRYREQGKFRQRDLALHLGSVQGTVSKAETGNRRLDVIELREWLLAMGVDFLEFMTALHEQLESLNHLEPWLIGRQPLPSEDSAHAPNPEQSAGGKGRDSGYVHRATELAGLLAELDRVSQLLRPDAAENTRGFEPDSNAAALHKDQAVSTLGAYLTDHWVPDLLRQWQAHWSKD